MSSPSLEHALLADAVVKNDGKSFLKFYKRVAYYHLEDVLDLTIRHGRVLMFGLLNTVFGKHYRSITVIRKLVKFGFSVEMFSKHLVLWGLNEKSLLMRQAIVLGAIEHGQRHLFEHFFSEEENIDLHAMFVVQYNPGRFFIEKCLLPFLKTCDLPMKNYLFEMAYVFGNDEAFQLIKNQVNHEEFLEKIEEQISKEMSELES